MYTKGVHSPMCVQFTKYSIKVHFDMVPSEICPILVTHSEHYKISKWLLDFSSFGK